MIKTDNHMHPFEGARSKDGMRSFLREAQKMGIEELTFTEHCPLLPGMSKASFDEYVVLTLELIKDISFPRVKLGIELDYHPQLVADADRLIQQYPFEYVLGTVHIHSEFYTDKIRGKSYDEAIAFALEMNIQAVDTGLFDAIAHLDFARWLSDENDFGAWSGSYAPRNHKDAFLEVLARMEKRGVALEVNSSGLTKSFSSLLPCSEVLDWAKAFDLMYLFGSDAHNAHDVGFGYEEVLGALDRCQKEKLVTFRRRKPVFLICEK